MKQIAIYLSLILLTISAGVAQAQSISFQGKVLGISFTSGNFGNMATATIEVNLDLGVTRKDNYSICQDISDREYSALFALLIDSRSRNKDSSFIAKPIAAAPDLYCITSITSP